MKFYNLVMAAVAAIVMTGCTGKGASESEHHHDEHMMLTAYNNDYEVFAETSPMAAGEPIEILAHFTHLDNFKPLEEGKVTAELIVGGNKETQTLEEPTRKGIYKFTLTPKKAGSAKLTFIITHLSQSSHNSQSPQSSQITIENLTVYPDCHEAEEAAEEAEVKSSNAIAFTKEMSWKVDFSTEEVANRPMGQVIRTMGQVQPSQGDVRTLTAKSSGTVSYVSGNLTDGSAVSAGQALFRIDGSSTADDNLRVRYLEAKSNYEAAKTEYDRKTELVKEKLITASEANRAKQELESAQAVYDNLRRGFSNGGSSVSSPIGGFITQLLVTNGQYVEAGQPLATVAQNRDLFIKAEVQPSYFPYLHEISGANLRRPNSEDTYSLEELGGAVVSYGKSVDAANPLIPVVFRVNNAAGFLPGSFVEMHINTGGQNEVTAVPNESLIEEMGNNFVYVQLTPEYFEKREVKTGRNDGRYTEIKSGLKPGERVVAKGAILVKLAHSSGTLDAHSGHVH